MSLAVLAQTPQGINYQTVIRDGTGNILPDTELSLQMTVRSGAPDGEAVYIEIHDVSTNAIGLINLVIGNGTPQSGTFAGIDWSAGDKYLETAVDLNGGNDFTILGVTQFLSVPYALFSKESESIKAGINLGEMLYWDGNEWVYVLPGTYGQALILCDGIPTWGGCLPVVTTSEVNVVSFNLAYGGGDVVSDGGNPVIQRGVCWDTLPNPTIEVNQGITQDGNGIGNFESVLDGLTAETNYFIRAYAINNKGIEYGEELNFETLPDYFTCGDVLIDERDSVQYSTFYTNGQCWMAENLAYLPLVYPGEQGSSNLPFYYVYDYFGVNVVEAKAIVNYQNYGVLYNWTASLSACPEGWHLPNDDDYLEFASFLGGSSAAGGKMKSTRTAPEAHPRWESPNTGATNESGFNALPCGYRHILFDFGDLGNVAIFRTSSIIIWASSGSTSQLEYDNGNLFVSYPGNDPDGYSIRCIMD